MFVLKEVVKVVSLHHLNDEPHPLSFSRVSVVDVGEMVSGEPSRPSKSSAKAVVSILLLLSLCITRSACQGEFQKAKFQNMAWWEQM